MKTSAFFKTLGKTTFMAAALSSMLTNAYAHEGADSGPGNRERSERFGPDRPNRGGGDRRVDRPRSRPRRGFERGQKKVINYDGEQFRGRNTLYLKRALKEQFPGINLRNKKLQAVVVMAKSRMGRGEATLTVGQQDSYPQTVPGSPNTFRDYAGYTYSRIKFRNTGGSRGVWQVQLRGNIKVKNVIVKFKGSNNTIKLYVGDQFRGESVLPIKRMLREQNPQALARLENLKKVTIVAKSRRGRGSAALKTGRDITREKTIDGVPYEFRTEDAFTYSQVSFQGPGYAFRGPMQILLRGNIKVKEVILQFRRGADNRN